MPGAKGRSGGSRTGSGRKTFKPTAAQKITCEELSATGASQETIARCIGVTVPTLAKHFVDELDGGRERVMSRIAQGLLQRALAGDNTASIFALKTRWKEHWSEKQKVELTGKDGTPIQNVNMTHDQFIAIAKSVAELV